MNVKKLYVADPLSREALEVMQMVKENCKGILARMDREDMLESFQQFCAAVSNGQEVVEIDGEPMAIPPLALQYIGSMASYATFCLLVEIAQEANAQSN